jgi:hypothetical protein
MVALFGIINRSLIVVVVVTKYGMDKRLDSVDKSKSEGYRQ